MSDSSTPPTAVTAGPPTLPGTADTTPYVPVSWAAVVAMLVSGVFVAVLLTVGVLFTILYKKKPFLEDWLLLFPAVAIVLSFAARRLIANSEATRTGVLFGVNLPDTAWWAAVVGGLGYSAYLFGINYSIRREAIGEVEKWAANVMKADESGLNRAFHRTRDPIERTKIDPDNRKILEGRWKPDYLAFRNSDLVRLALRNPEKATFKVGGLRDWASLPNEVDCVVAGTVRCPEGTFPISVPLRGVETPGGLTGRQWQVRMTGERGYIIKDEARLTQYGWFVNLLQAQGTDIARQFMIGISDRRDRMFVYSIIANSEDNPALRFLNPARAPALVAGFGGPALAGIMWSDKTFQDSASRLFKMEGNVAPSPDQAKMFFTAWNTAGLNPPGTRIRDGADNVEILVITESSIEIRVPVEILVITPQSGPTSARGRLVLSCVSPEALTEANKLRAAADPDRPAEGLPEEYRRKSTEWRVVRVESDLVPVVARAQNLPAPPEVEPPPLP